MPRLSRKRNLRGKRKSLRKNSSKRRVVKKRISKRKRKMRGGVDYGHLGEVARHLECHDKKEQERQDCVDKKFYADILTSELEIKKDNELARKARAKARAKTKEQFNGFDNPQEETFNGFGNEV